MPTFKLTISADALPDIEGEQLRARITNHTDGDVNEFFGPPDAAQFEVEYVGGYGDELSIVRDWTFTDADGDVIAEGPDAEAVNVTLPFPVLPMPSGGGVSVAI